jgi:hypothetical protein
MSRASEVLDEYWRAGVVARAEMERLLSAAGLVVTELVPDGDGWRLRLAQSAPGVVPREAAPVATDARAGGRSTLSVAPLVRRPGETLMELVGRADGRFRIRRAATGAGGIGEGEVQAQERICWLGGTLVGDTMLALRHLGEPEDGEDVVVELRRQFGLFEQESVRLVGTSDSAPFLAAIDRWMPPAFPRGDAFLAGVEGSTHA